MTNHFASEALLSSAITRALCMDLARQLPHWSGHSAKSANLASLTSCRLHVCVSKIIILLLWSAVDVGKVYIGRSTNDTQHLYAFSSNIPSSSWTVPVYLHGGTAGTVCIAFCIVTCFVSLYFYIHTLCPPKMCHPLVTIILLLILTDFQNSFTAGKSVKFAIENCITLPTTPKMCCHTTSRTLSIQICCML